MVQMSQYTYTLHTVQEESPATFYKRNELEKMTTFHLQEICRKERLVVPSHQRMDKEALVRLIMRFRGQKEYRHIEIYCEGGLERIQQYLHSHEVQFSNQMEIQLPGVLTLYQQTQINELDGYQLHSKENLYEGNLLLVDETLHIYTCFYLQKIQQKTYLFKGKDVLVFPIEKHQYFLMYLPKERDSEFLYDCYHNNPCISPGILESIRIPLLDVQQKSILPAEFPLVIDLGSSNTTMGICLSDGTMQIATVKASEIIPSLVGVCRNAGEEAQFVFGHDAKTLFQENYRDNDIAVFYDIKRWISNPNRSEAVILPDGYKYQFSRKEMLRAYLEYLFNLAQQQFKCSFTSIQMLAPIRQREKFEEFFKDLLPEYNIHCELDEGMAVLFHSIDTMITQKNYQGKQWYQALIIDCGGGTTDLTSGRFYIDNNRVSYVIRLETRYENGDTNFGGNNLTYRILQLLKVRIVEQLGFFPKGTTDIEQSAANKIEELYQQAERWLPTQFNYQEKSREEYFFIKNNYYYLFGMAEELKKKFFQKELCYELKLSTEKQTEESPIYLDKWRLSVCENGKFVTIKEPLAFSIYRNEVEELLRPDIYGLMERFLEKKFQQGQLQNYDMIKLTGQSCKSKLFTEALKEYVPGKLIKSTKQQKDGTELKMCCLRRALSHYLNCKLGYINVIQDYQVASLPYEVSAFTHENQEKILVHSMDSENHIGYISRFRIGNQLDLYLNDEQGNRLKTYCYEYNTSLFTKTTQEEIDQMYEGTVIQEETDTIVEGEMKFFVWVSRKRWGIVVLPILRDGQLLYKGPETFFDFEDDTWERNFFDGKN